jgi:hypothetical protein
LLRKSIPIVAWYVLSNVSYIKLATSQTSEFRLQAIAETHRVIRLVLPTLWSPSSTIFVRFNVPDEASVVGDVGLAISNRF